MIARVHMQDNLDRLDRLYRKARTAKESLFYAKLAVLELCGWIEESMDDVLLRCSMRCLRDKANRAFAANSIVKRNYGFDYDRNFREMLIKLLGLTQVEKIERRVDPVLQTRLKSTLTTLTTVRNSEAHTHLKGVTRTINAPSVTKSHFGDVYAGLVEYDRVIRHFVA